MWWLRGAELLSQRLQQLRLDPEYMKVCHASVYEEVKRVCASCKFQEFARKTLPPATCNLACVSIALARRSSMQ